MNADEEGCGLPAEPVKPKQRYSHRLVPPKCGSSTKRGWDPMKKDVLPPMAMGGGTVGGQILLCLQSLISLPLRGRASVELFLRGMFSCKNDANILNISLAYIGVHRRLSAVNNSSLNIL